MIEEVVIASKCSSGKVLMNLGVTIAITIAVVFNLLFWDMRLGPGEFSALLVVLEINAIFLPLTFLIVTIVKGMQKSDLRVSNLRVFGKAAFGKSFDIPLDSVTAVNTVALRGIRVATPTGDIRFRLFANAGEVSTALSELLATRRVRKQGDGSSALINGRML